MFCQYCGAQLEADSRFCQNCGNACAVAQVVPESRLGKKDGTRLWRILLGLLLMVCSVAGYRLMVDLDAMFSTMEMNRVMASMGTYYLVAASVLNSLIGISAIFLSSPWLILFAAGAALVFDRKGAYRSALVASSFCGISVVLLLILNFNLPDIAKWFSNTMYDGSEVANVVRDFLREDPDRRWYYKELILPASLLWAVALAGSALAYFKTKANQPAVKMSRSTASLMILLPFIPILQWITTALFPGAAATGFGTDDVVMARSYASMAMAEVPQISPVYIVMVLVLLYMIFKDKGSWIPLLGAVAFAVLAAGNNVLAGFAELEDTLADMRTFSDTSEALANRFLLCSYIGRGALLAALAVWLWTSVRGCIPAWLQMGLVILAFGAAYGGMKLVGVLDDPTLPGVELMTSLVMILACLPLGALRRQE